MANKKGLSLAQLALLWVNTPRASGKCSSSPHSPEGMHVLPPAPRRPCAPCWLVPGSRAGPALAPVWLQFQADGCNPKHRRDKTCTAPWCTLVGMEPQNLPGSQRPRGCSYSQLTAPWSSARLGAGAVHGWPRGFVSQAQPGLRHHAGLWGSAQALPSLWGGSCCSEAADSRRSKPQCTEPLAALSRGAEGPVVSATSEI